MDQDQNNDILGESDANIEASRDETKNGKTISKGSLDNVNPKMSEKNSGEKSNKCSQCGFASSWKSSLKIHLKMHNEETSNKCNQCDYASSTVSNFRRHLKTHSGEKLCKCNQCYYACFRADVLAIHMKRHSGDKTNKCKQCGFAFFYGAS